ncbi:MAG: hypothetical protein AAF682_14375 [Planctomycetota bacterium]
MLHRALFPLVTAALLSASPTAQEHQASGVGGYLVVELALDGADGFAAAARAVAREAAEFHDGRVVAFDGEDWERWRDVLRSTLPDEVLFVVPPEVLDVPLHRRILLASADLDDDLLPDFSWGYLTAADGEGLRELWERTVRVHEQGLNGRTWHEVGVTSGMKSTVYPGYVSTTAKAAGFTGDGIFIATVDADPDHQAFVAQQLPRLEQAAVVALTGNGDPKGIWLFAGERNMDPSLHWDFSPERVGEDPEGAMPRLTADRIAGLELSSPVVWSGTCHSGATHRVFVEGDIVSTFGTTDRATLYRMPPERSLCLAVLEAGAVAFLAPLGANHGMAVSREHDAALIRGCSLGEAVKSTWDDVFLAAGGAPRLHLPVPGEPHGRGEPVMRGGGSNRVLIGDPALAPFAPTPRPGESTSAVSVEGGLDVTARWEDGWHPMAWDMYGDDRGADWRVVARVPLDELLPASQPLPAWSVTVDATGADGEPQPYALRHAVVESWRGERWLHLQASAPREQVERKHVNAVFRVRW